MFLVTPLHRALARLSALLLAVVLLAAGTTLVGAPSQAREEARSGAAAPVPGGRFSVATLNLRKGMRVPGLRHDIGPVSYTHLTLPTILLV